MVLMLARVPANLREADVVEQPTAAGGMRIDAVEHLTARGVFVQSVVDELADRAGAERGTERVGAVDRSGERVR